MISNIACLKRKQTIRESRSAYLNGFSSAIMKHKRLVWKYDTTFVLSKQIKHISKHPRIASCMGIVISNICVNRILKNRCEGAYLDGELKRYYGKQDCLIIGA